MNLLRNRNGMEVCITRVPGGWVYTIYSHVHPDSYHVSIVFVPFHNEFQTADEEASRFQEGASSEA